MSSPLKSNAYHILGLDTTVRQKDILKRSKEIINRLKIDDLPEYDRDLGFFNDFRTEETVKEAIQKLQTPKNRIREYFFWFQIVDGVDEEAFRFIKKKDYQSAIRTWQNASDDNSLGALPYKKNLAILYTLLLMIDGGQEYSGKSLLLLKAVTGSK